MPKRQIPKNKEMLKHTFTKKKKTNAKQYYTFINKKWINSALNFGANFFFDDTETSQQRFLNRNK